MKRFHLPIYSAFLLLAAAGGPLYAASPYDDYYNSYQQPDSEPADVATVDNDSYYTAPEGDQYPVDNDAYYSAPGSYSSEYPQPRSGGNCNTIGDVPSCGGN